MKPELTLLLLPLPVNSPPECEAERRQEISVFFAKHQIPHQVLWITEPALNPTLISQIQGRYFVFLDQNLRVPLAEIFSLLQAVSENGADFAFIARRLEPNVFSRRWTPALNEGLGTTFYDPFSPFWLGPTPSLKALPLPNEISWFWLGPHFLRAGRQSQKRMVERPLKQAVVWSTPSANWLHRCRRGLSLFRFLLTTGKDIQA